MYGSFVRAVREARGMSQATLAAVSGIPQPNISAIERDRRVPTVDTLNRIVVACGFRLAAVAGERALHAPLPKVGWFPDEDLPPPVDGDPPDEAPMTDASTPIDERLRHLDAVLALVDERRAGR